MRIHGYGVLLVCFIEAISLRVYAQDLSSDPIADSSPCGAALLADQAPSDCSTDVSAVYCGCLWNGGNGKVWFEQDRITLTGCNTPYEGEWGTPYFKKVAPALPSVGLPLGGSVSPGGRPQSLPGMADGMLGSYTPPTQVRPIDPSNVAVPQMAPGILGTR